MDTILIYTIVILIIITFTIISIFAGNKILSKNYDNKIHNVISQVNENQSYAYNNSIKQERLINNLTSNLNFVDNELNIINKLSKDANLNLTMVETQYNHYAPSNLNNIMKINQFIENVPWSSQLSNINNLELDYSKAVNNIKVINTSNAIQDNALSNLNNKTLNTSQVTNNITANLTLLSSNLNNKAYYIETNYILKNDVNNVLSNYNTNNDFNTKINDINNKLSTITFSLSNMPFNYTSSDDIINAQRNITKLRSDITGVQMMLNPIQNSYINKTDPLYIGLQNGQNIQNMVNSQLQSTTDTINNITRTINNLTNVYISKANFNNPKNGLFTGNQLCLDNVCITKDHFNKLIRITNQPQAQATPQPQAQAQPINYQYLGCYNDLAFQGKSRPLVQRDNINANTTKEMYDKCAEIAKANNHDIFAIQADNVCMTGTYASQSYARDGQSGKCYPDKNGNLIGSSWTNAVFRITNQPQAQAQTQPINYQYLGCYNDLAFQGKSRPLVQRDNINANTTKEMYDKCAEIAKANNHDIFAIQADNVCMTGTYASQSYARDGQSGKCYPDKNGNLIGSSWTNAVFRITN